MSGLSYHHHLAGGIVAYLYHVCAAGGGVELQRIVLNKLAQIPLGSGGSEAKLTDDGLCGEFLFIGHERQNIDYFMYGIFQNV